MKRDITSGDKKAPIPLIKLCVFNHGPEFWGCSHTMSVDAPTTTKPSDIPWIKTIPNNSQKDLFNGSIIVIKLRSRKKTVNRGWLLYLSNNFPPSRDPNKNPNARAVKIKLITSSGTETWLDKSGKTGPSEEIISPNKPMIAKYPNDRTNDPIRAISIFFKWTYPFHWKFNRIAEIITSCVFSQGKLLPNDGCYSVKKVNSNSQ